MGSIAQRGMRIIFQAIEIEDDAAMAAKPALNEDVENEDLE